MKVLITGATGFLGGYTAEIFMKNGYEVVCFGRNQKSGEKLRERGATFIKGDFTNQNEINAACNGADIVVHAGALSSAWGKWDDFYKANVIGTINVREACHTNGVKRLIFISSPSIYSSTKNRLNIKENEFNPKNKLNSYIKSKIMAEDELLKNRQSGGPEIVILRPRGIFGIGDPSLLPRILASYDKIGIPLVNGGMPIIDITHVKNVSHAILLSASAENIDGETFNITNDDPKSLKEIMEMLFHALKIPPKYFKTGFRKLYLLAVVVEMFYKLFRLKKEPILTRYNVCVLGRSQTLNISKAKRMLNYVPIISIEEGIKDYAERTPNNRS